MRNIITFIHGGVYASLILVSCFAYGLYTAQVRAHAKNLSPAVYYSPSEDYVTTLSNQK